MVLGCQGFVFGYRFGMAGGQVVVQFFGNAACGQQAGEKAKCRDTDRFVHRK